MGPGDYTIVAGGRGTPRLLCRICEEQSPIHSNAAVLEELDLQVQYLHPRNRNDPWCRKETCKLFRVPYSQSAGMYIKFGKTPSGTPRFRCKACKSTFAGQAKPAARQRKPEKNRDIFVLAVNRAPISRLLETVGIGWDSFYRKLRFIHEQCRIYSGKQEQQMLKPDFEMPKMYLSTDRQFYIVNWTQRSDRRTVQMNAIGTADRRTGYVFGMALNFDELLNQDEVEADAAALGDADLAQPHRKYARVWLRQDYLEALAEAKHRNSAEATAKARVAGTALDPLLVKATMQYFDAVNRDNIEHSDFKNEEVKLPVFGMQIHEQYTIYAHFALLAELLKNAPKVRLFMDQDSGFRAAAFAAFGSRIKERTADAFFVRVDKDANAYQKRNAVAKAQEKLAVFMLKNGISDQRIGKVELMKVEIKKAVKLVKRWEDHWVRHPAPIAAEPKKFVCWLTDCGDYDEDHQAQLLLLATLHPIDRFFMQTRRRVSMAERPIVSVRQQRNMWHGYSAYNPAVLQRHLEIYRTYYNYCLAGKDKKTPAMRLGLTNSPIDPNVILRTR